MSEKPEWPFQNWWQCEPGGSVSTEELYQAFKARLMRELVAQNPAVASGEHFEIPAKNYALVDAPSRGGGEK